MLNVSSFDDKSGVIRFAMRDDRVSFFVSEAWNVGEPRSASHDSSWVQKRVELLDRTWLGSSDFCQGSKIFWHQSNFFAKELQLRLFDEEDSSVLNFSMSKKFWLADWTIFFCHSKESLGLENVSPLDEAFSESIEVSQNWKVPRVELTERIEVNFLQMIGSQKNGLLEFFALKFLMIFVFGHSVMSDLRNSGPCHQAWQSQSSVIEIVRVPMSARLTTPGTWSHWRGSVKVESLPHGEQRKLWMTWKEC